MESGWSDRSRVLIGDHRGGAVGDLDRRRAGVRESASGHLAGAAVADADADSLRVPDVAAADRRGAAVGHCDTGVADPPVWQSSTVGRPAW
jgi:hypothetical protein